jgi:hypothetical protein
MNSGLGSIGRKWVKWIKRMVIGSFRRLAKRPGVNALCLLVIFYILNFQFEVQATTGGRFIFENRQLGLFAQYSVSVIPILLFINSFLFRRVWKIVVSAVASSMLTIYMLFWLMLWMAFADFDDTLPMRQTTSPDDQITTLYHRTTSKMVFGEDVKHCRFLVHQRRVFPGILRNEHVRGEVCLLRGERFPPELQ